MQITSGYFCAGLLVDGKGRVARAAPILGWTIGKDWLDVARYAQKKHWKMTKVNAPQIHFPKLPRNGVVFGAVAIVKHVEESEGRFYAEAEIVLTEDVDKVKL